MRSSIAVCAALLILGGCATSLSPSGALQPTAATVLADGTSPLQVVADQGPVYASRDGRSAGLVRLVSDDPLDELGAPPVPPAPAGMDGMPVVGLPAAPAFPQPAARTPYFRAEDEPPMPPTEQVLEEEVIEEEVIEETPLEVIEAPAPDMGAPVLQRGGCGGCGKPSCQVCCEPCDERGYMGLGFSVLPGFGGGLEFGMHTKITQTAMWSIEFGMHYQDMSESLSGENASGSLMSASAGMRIRFQPRARGHVTARAGLSWLRTDGNPHDLDTASLDWRGDYIGVYAGIGYEFDLGCNWTTGPEARVFAGYAFNQLQDRVPRIGANAGRDDFGFYGMFIWHLDYRF